MSVIPFSAPDPFNGDPVQSNSTRTVVALVTSLTLAEYPIPWTFYLEPLGPNLWQRRYGIISQLKYDPLETDSWPKGCRKVVRRHRYERVRIVDTAKSSKSRESSERNLTWSALPAQSVERGLFLTITHATRLNGFPISGKRQAADIIYYAKDIMIELYLLHRSSFCVFKRHKKQALFSEIDRDSITINGRGHVTAA